MLVDALIAVSFPLDHGTDDDAVAKDQIQNEGEELGSRGPIGLMQIGYLWSIAAISVGDLF